MHLLRYEDQTPLNCLEKGRDFVYGLEGQEVLEGSKDSPCRAFHPLTFPRDGHEPYHGALGSQDFPLKQEDMGQSGSQRSAPSLSANCSHESFLLDHQSYSILPDLLLLC